MSRRQPADYIFGTGPDAHMVMDAATATALLQSQALQELVTKIASRADDTRIADQLLALIKLKHEFTRDGPTGVTETAASQPNSGRWYSTKSASEALGISPDAVRQACHRKQLPARKSDGRLYVAAADLDLYKRTRHGNQ